MTEEATQNLTTLAARFAEEMRSFNMAQDEARNRDDIGYQIAMRDGSRRLLELRQAIEAAGGTITGKSVVGPDHQVVASWPTESPSNH